MKFNEKGFLSQEEFKLFLVSYGVVEELVMVIVVKYLFDYVFFEEEVQCKVVV